MTPDDLRAALEPVFRAAVLDAFKLGVGHAIAVIEEFADRPDGFWPRGPLGMVADELRTRVATMTYEDLP